MSRREEHRQLAAIMFTDIVGYTTLMAADESSALRALRESRKLVRRLARKFGGRWLESIGDGNLISFASATDAVNCALALQKMLDADRDPKLRIGVHVGDVIEAAGHIYGDGVNVASRIQALAEPGGVVVSEPVYDAVRNKEGIRVERLGVREIRGLDHPIQAYSIAGDAVDAPLLGAMDLPEKRRRVMVLAIPVLLLAVLAVALYGRFGSVQAADPSVAVMPFEDLSPDSGNQYFSEGISEELINGLARVPGLRVAGRGSSFAHAGRDQDARELGRLLDVAYILDGSVRRAGDRVRISAQLVGTQAGFQLWSETYETDMDDIFQVQQNISQSIVEALRLALLPRELADVGRISTRDVTAYDLYLQARAAIRGANAREDYDRAIELLENALRRDPTFAEAEAAHCEARVGKYRQTRESEVLAPAVEICNRALAMDPDAARVHMALGDLYMATGRAGFAVESYARALPLAPDNDEVYLGLAGALMEQGRSADAETYFERALELKPDNGLAYQLYGAAMARAGRYDRAEMLLRRAIELDPDNSRSYSHLGAVMYYQGRFADASQAFIRANEIEPYDKAYNNIGALLFFAGEFDRSVAMLRKAVAMTPHDPRLVGGLADACRLASDCSEWRELYERAIALADERLAVNPNDGHVVGLKAVHLLHLGRREEAVDLVARAVALEPENRDVMVNAAIFWSQYGDKARAAEFVEKALALGYPDAQLHRHPDIQLAES